MDSRIRENYGKPINSSNCLWWDGNREVECSCLDARFVGKLGFVKYLPQDNGGSVSSSVELQVEALHKLLLSPYHVFWSHVLYDDDLNAFIDSYLRFCSRAYDDDFVAYSGKDLRSVLFQRVFKVVLRASSARESRDFFMDNEYFETWVKSDKSWFDLPRLMDICTLYRGACLKVVRALVESMFRCNNKLYDDLKKASAALVKTIERAPSVKDGELFVLDGLCSVVALLNVVPKVAKHIQSQGTIQVLDSCVSKFLPSFQRKARIKRLCVAVAFQLLDSCFLTRVYESGSNKYQESVAKELIGLLEQLASSQLFLAIHAQYDLRGRLIALLNKGNGLPRDVVEKIAMSFKEVSSIPVEQEEEEVKEVKEQDKGKEEACMAEVVEEQGPNMRSIHKGKMSRNEEEVDHKMRVFISRFAEDAYNDEYDDSFAVHAKLVMEPLDEEEQEKDEVQAPPPPNDENEKKETVEKDATAPPADKQKRGRGKQGRKQASMKKHGMLQ